MSETVEVSPPPDEAESKEKPPERENSQADAEDIDLIFTDSVAPEEAAALADGASQEEEVRCRVSPQQQGWGEDEIMSMTGAAPGQEAQASRREREEFPFSLKEAGRTESLGSLQKTSSGGEKAGEGEGTETEKPEDHVELGTPTGGRASTNGSVLPNDPAPTYYPPHPPPPHSPTATLPGQYSPGSNPSDSPAFGPSNPSGSPVVAPRDQAAAAASPSLAAQRDLLSFTPHSSVAAQSAASSSKHHHAFRLSPPPGPTTPSANGRFHPMAKTDTVATEESHVSSGVPSRSITSGGLLSAPIAPTSVNVDEEQGGAEVFADCREEGAPATNLQGGGCTEDGRETISAVLEQSLPQTRSVTRVPDLNKSLGNTEHILQNIQSILHEQNEKAPRGSMMSSVGGVQQTAGGLSGTLGGAGGGAAGGSFSPPGTRAPIPLFERGPLPPFAGEPLAEGERSPNKSAAAQIFERIGGQSPPEDINKSAAAQIFERIGGATGDHSGTHSHDVRHQSGDGTRMSDR